MLFLYYKMIVNKHKKMKMVEKIDIESFEDYLTDASNFKGNAEKLIIPETSEEITEALKQANANNCRVTIAGAGTGLTGARVPEGGAVLSMERFNKILEFDKANKLLTVQAFVRLNEITEFLNGSGLFYPVNPTESLASIGGNIGNNASGSRTFRYGATRKYVEALKIILPNGENLTLKRGEIFAKDGKLLFKSNEGTFYEILLTSIDMPKVKHAAGYYISPNMDLIDLFIGAEGTLGIVEEVTLRLTDEPEFVSSFLTFFDDLALMYSFIRLMQNKDEDSRPRLIEFFDDNSLNLLRSKIIGIPDSAKYAIWVEFELSQNDEDSLIEDLYNSLSNCTSLADQTWIANDEPSLRRLKDFRHELPLAVYEKIQQYNQPKLGTDTAVPDMFVESYHKEMITLLQENGIDYVIWGHIGNSHFHCNIITKNNQEYIKALQIFDIIVQRAVELGGTVSAEHGIGKLKKRFLRMLFDDKTFVEFRMIKQVIDPNLILNIGNIFDI